MKITGGTIKNIQIEVKELSHFSHRVKKRKLRADDYDIILGLTQTIVELTETLNKKNITIKKLRAMVFGYTTESSRTILKTNKTCRFSKEKIQKKKRGHGRNGISAYTGAKTYVITHNELKKGDSCPRCPVGKTYPVRAPKVVLNLCAHAPIQANKYELEKLRCNACGSVFTAQPPAEAGHKKYDETTAAMIALLKYGNGFPFYRLAQLQKNLGIPLPASTQWELIEKFADCIYPVYDELVRHAAQGTRIHTDDTTTKILALSCHSEDNVKQEEKPIRTGIFTTGIISRSDEYDIALFFSGNKHAGENMTDVLSKRNKNLKAPLHMCDALSRNQAKDFDVILANCLAHARRYFVDVFHNFSEQCRFVIDLLGTVYKYDEITRERNMSPDDRLKFHQKKSEPLMKKLKAWLARQFDEKLAEPNSSLGKAISYMLNHWERLTMFLTIPGMPLDNNICERALKKVILHRKNSYFFKTEHGAYIGDLFMSLIHTCNLMNVNAFQYLSTIYRHCSKAFKSPQDWMPWNYTKQVFDSS